MLHSASLSNQSAIWHDREKSAYYLVDAQCRSANLSGVWSYHARRGKPKAGTDWRDLAMLLVTFPELKNESGAVSKALSSFDAGEEVINEWSDLVKQEIRPATDEDEFD